MVSSRVVYRRRRIVAVLILTTVVSIIWFSISSFSNGNNSNQATISTTSGTESKDFTQPGEVIFLPSEGASAVGISELGVIATNGVATPVPIASIAKTITILVILNKLAPTYGQAKEINITFGQQDVEIRASTIAENGASQPVSDGLSMSLHDALAIMMLASANNYATSLAIKTFGSMEEYILAANDWLKVNGLSQTSVADASGLNPNTVGTASDLVNLGLIAMDNQEVVDIVTTPEISVDGVGTIQNGNPMFGIDGVDGIKLGSTFEANNCLLYSKLVNIDGKEMPSIVEGMHPADINYIRETEKVPEDVKAIAVRSANKREAEGKSPFWNEKEYKKGGKVRGHGIEKRGKTKGRFV